MMDKRPLGKAILWGALSLAVASGFLVARRLDIRPRTDDAFIDARIIHLAPEISGRVISFHVMNNQDVRRGDVLFEIDPEPYRLRSLSAKAQARMLEAKIDDTMNQIASQVSHADAESSAIESARANLVLAEKTLARRETLVEKGFATLEQVDQARTARDSARAALQQSLNQAKSAQQAISNIRPLQEQLQASRAEEALAERDLQKTVVRAPCDGKVIGLTTAAGEYAVTGTPIFNLIDTSTWYAVANFRETEIGSMVPGTPASVFLMASPGKPILGHIESIGWAVLPDEAGLVNGTPHVAKTLNWVKLAQRFPVRVRLDAPSSDELRVGETAVVVVRHETTK
jgi:multidrug efflux system membrane fusion protein